MPKIRIVEVMGKPVVPNVSLGSEMVREPQEIVGRDMRGQEFSQWIPGQSRNRKLLPGETADVNEDFARIVCDEKSICERIPGRPKKSAEPPPEPSD